MNINIKKNSEAALSLIIAVLFALIIRIYVFEPFTIPSGSMKPNLIEGDYIFVSKFPYGISKHSIPFSPNIFSGRILKLKEPQRGDVIVFKLPSDTSIYYIKRLIGVPGDKIQVKNGIIYINENIVQRKIVDPFLDDDGQIINKFIENLPSNKSYYVLDETPFGRYDNTPLYEVPEGHYFFMGDNRDNSGDSRAHVGFVPEENLVGRADMIIFSNKVSIFKIWEWIFNFNTKRFFKKIN